MLFRFERAILNKQIFVGQSYLFVFSIFVCDLECASEISSHDYHAEIFCTNSKAEQ